MKLTVPLEGPFFSKGKGIRLLCYKERESFYTGGHQTAIFGIGVISRIWMSHREIGKSGFLAHQKEAVRNRALALGNNQTRVSGPNRESNLRPFALNQNSVFGRFRAASHGGSGNAIFGIRIARRLL